MNREIKRGEERRGAEWDLRRKERQDRRQDKAVSFRHLAAT